MDRPLARELLLLATLVACAAAFYRIQIVWLAGIAIIAFASICCLRPHLGVLSVVVFLPYFMQEKSIGGHLFPVSEALLGATVLGSIGCWILGLVASRVSQSVFIRIRGSDFPHLDWKGLFDSRFLFPAGLFVIAAGASTVLSAERHLAFREYLEVVVEPVILFILLVLWGAGSNKLARARFLGLSLVILIATGLTPSLIAIIQYVTHTGLTSASSGYLRAPGPYSSADNLGLLIDRTLPPAIAVACGWIGGVLLSTREEEGKRQLARPEWSIIAAVVACLFMAAALVLTFVLGAWIACFLTALLIILLRLRLRRFAPIAAATLAILLLALAFTPLANSIVKVHGVSGGRRIDIWQSAVHMIAAKPIFGIGPDNFQHYYAPKHGDGVSPHATSPSGRCSHGLGYIRTSALAEPCLSHPHDEFLDFWLSTGVAGLAAAIWLYVVFWSIIWTHRRDLATGPVLAGVAAATFAGLIHGLVDNSYFLIDLGTLTWFLFGLASLYSYSLDTPSTLPAQGAPIR